MGGGFEGSRLTLDVVVSVGSFFITEVETGDFDFAG